MPFGFGKKDNDKVGPIDDSIEPLDKDDYGEIEKIKEMLNPNEVVIVVARQSRILPGGSYITPNVIYATNRRIIMRDPYMLGIKENILDIPYDVITSVKLEKGLFSSEIRFEAPAIVGSKRLGMIHGIVSGETDNEGVIQAIPKRKAEDLVQVIRSGMYGYQSNSYVHAPLRQQSAHNSTSVADELTKLAKLREQEVLTPEEFERIKKNILEGKR
ncbi:MAG TPA: PH domain-containing protein [Nitrososphaeraceae archaeon]|nr:PH domain-containing protein [Nitrososphaeraceae archaeon]